MTMIQILGDFNEQILADGKILMIELFVHSIPLQRRKQTRYLSIAFIANYLVTLFGSNEKEQEIILFERNLQIKSTVNYIANELLENSLKFNEEALKYPIKFGICLIERNLVFIAINCVNEKRLSHFKKFVDELNNSDSEELYFRKLEKNAEENSNESGLGLLTMINDYNAKLGWKIETVSYNPEITTITTMVQLTI